LPIFGCSDDTKFRADVEFDLRKYVKVTETRSQRWCRPRLHSCEVWPKSGQK